MKKKMLLATAIFAVGLFAAPVMASEQSTIDYDSMSTEELVALRDEINAKIAERGGDNVIGSGVYEVGKDIKASNFKVSCYDGSDGVGVYLYPDGDHMTNSDCIFDSFLVYDETKTTQECAVLNLTDGEVLYLSGSLIIEDASSSFWMPEN